MHKRPGGNCRLAVWLCGPALERRGGARRGPAGPPRSGPSHRPGPAATRLSELRWNTERRPRPPAHANHNPGPAARDRWRRTEMMAGEGCDVPAPGRPRPRSGSCGVNSDTRPIQNTARKIMTCPSVFPREQHGAQAFAGRLNCFFKFETSWPFLIASENASLTGSVRFNSKTRRD